MAAAPPSFEDLRRRSLRQAAGVTFAMVLIQLAPWPLALLTPALVNLLLQDARFEGAGAPRELEPIYEKLNDLLARIEAGFERERRFSADLAHEMRTPVAELKMLAEVAMKWPEQGAFFFTALPLLALDIMA